MLLLEADIYSLEVPTWPEFSVDNMWTEAVKSRRFMKYIPDTWGPGHRSPERDYFFKILATVEWDWLYSQVKTITDARVRRRMETVPKAVPTLQISSDWILKLLAMPVDPCKLSPLFIEFM